MSSNSFAKTKADHIHGISGFNNAADGILQNMVSNEMTSDIQDLLDCLEKEYCLELAKKFRNIMASVLKCKKPRNNEIDRSIDQKKSRLDNIEKVLKQLNEIDSALQGAISNGKNGHVSLNSMTIKNVQDIIDIDSEFNIEKYFVDNLAAYTRIKTYITNIMNGEQIIINTDDVINNTIVYRDFKEIIISLNKLMQQMMSSDLDPKEHMQITKNVNNIESVYNDAINQLFSPIEKGDITSVNNSREPNSTIQRIQVLSDKNCIKDMYKVTSMNVLVSREDKSISSYGEDVKERNYRVRSKNSKKGEKEFNSNDVMSVSMINNKCVLYLYHTLYDILKGRIDFDAVTSALRYRHQIRGQLSSYILSRENILNLEINNSDSDSFFKDELTRILMILCALIATTMYNSESASRYVGIEDKCEIIQKNGKPRSENTRAMIDSARKLDIVDNYISILQPIVNGKSDIESKVDYYDRLYDLLMNLGELDKIDDNTLVRYKASIDVLSALHSQQESTRDLYDVNNYYSKNMDPRVKSCLMLRNRCNKDSIKSNLVTEFQLTQDQDNIQNKNVCIVSELTDPENDFKRNVDKSTSEFCWNTYYNIVPHIFMYYESGTGILHYIPVGDIKTYQAAMTPEDDNTSISLSSFMFAPRQNVFKRNKNDIDAYFYTLGYMNMSNSAMLSITMQENSPVQRLLNDVHLKDSSKNSVIEEVIEATPENYELLYNVMLNADNTVTFNIVENINDNYATYSDEDLGKIIEDLMMNTVFDTPQDNSVQRQEMTAYGNSSELFSKTNMGTPLYNIDKYAPENGMVSIKRGIFYGNYTLNLMLKNKNISPLTEEVNVEKLISSEFQSVPTKLANIYTSKILGTTSSLYNSANSACLIIKIGNLIPLPFMQKSCYFNGSVEIEKQLLNRFTDPIYEKYYNELENIPLTQHNINMSTNMRRNLMKILKQYKSNMLKDINQSVSISKDTYEFIFNYGDNRYKILDRYLTELQNYLRNIINTIINPLITRWMSDREAYQTLKNIVEDYSEKSTQIYENFNISKNVLEDLLNAVLLICKCTKYTSSQNAGKNNSKRIFSRGETADGKELVVQYNHLKTLQLNRDTIDYDSVTLNDLIGYNLMDLSYYDIGSDTLSYSCGNSKYFKTDANNVNNVSLELSDSSNVDDLTGTKKIYNVSSFIVRLFYGLNSIYDTIKEVSQVKEEPAEAVSNITTNIYKQEGDKLINRVSHVSGIFNVNDGMEDTSLFDWKEIIDWGDNYTEETRLLFNSWMRACITYLRKVTKIVCENIGSKKTTKRLGLSSKKEAVYTSAGIDFLVAFHIMNIISGIRNTSGTKPTVDELKNILFFNINEPDQRVDNKVKYYLRIHDEWLTNIDSDMDIAEIILYTEGYIGTGGIVDYKSGWLSKNISRYIHTYTNGIRESKNIQIDSSTAYRNGNKFNELCNKVLIYRNISDDVLLKFNGLIDKIESDYSTDDRDTINSDKNIIKRWIDETGIYDLHATCRTSRDIYNFVTLLSDSENLVKEITGKELNNYSLGIRDFRGMGSSCNIITCLRDVSMIKEYVSSKFKNMRKVIWDIKDEADLNNTAVKIHDFMIDAIKNQRIWDSSGEVKIEESSSGERFLRDYIKENYFISNDRYIRLGLTISDVDNLTTSISRKIIRLTNCDAEIYLLVKNVDSLVSEANVSVTEDFRYLNISQGARFKVSCTQEQIDNYRSRAKNLSNRVVALKVFQEYCAKCEIDKIAKEYKELNNEVSLNVLSFNDLCKVSTQAINSANLAFKYYLMSGNEIYFKPELLRLVSDDLLFCSNWDDKYAIASPFSVRSVLRSLTKIGVNSSKSKEVLLLRGDGSSEDERIPSEIFDNVYKNATYKKYLNYFLSDKSTVSRYKVDSESNLINTGSLFNLYDSFLVIYHNYVKSDTSGNISEQEMWRDVQKYYESHYKPYPDKRDMVSDILELIVRSTVTDNDNDEKNQKTKSILDSFIEGIKQDALNYISLVPDFDDSLNDIYYAAEQAIVAMQFESEDGDDTNKELVDAYKELLRDEIPYQVFARMTQYSVKSDLPSVPVYKKDDSEADKDGYDTVSGTELYNRTQRLKVNYNGTDERCLFDYIVLDNSGDR